MTHAIITDIFSAPQAIDAVMVPNFFALRNTASGPIKGFKFSSDSWTGNFAPQSTYVGGAFENLDASMIPCGGEPSSVHMLSMTGAGDGLQASRSILSAC